MIGSCYGKENKLRIVKNYYLTPLHHIKLLNNQEKKGCCGKLTDQYYIFQAKNKVSNESERFIVGKNCAEQLLELINHKKLELFNPLKHTPTENNNSLKNNSTNNINHDRVKLNAFNQQLITAMTLLCACWNTYPKGGWEKILKYTYDKPNIKNVNGLVWFNQFLKEKDKTLTEIVDHQRKYNKIKDYDFGLLVSELESQGENSFI